jgi:RimJ/RimL family protein N-acetyltransferase
VANPSGLRHDALMDQPQIKSEDLLVRPWQIGDAKPIFRACQDPEIQRWTPVPRPYELAHAVDYITNVATQAWADRSAAHFGVFDGETDELLGSMSIVRMDLASKAGELGYWTAPTARGRGVATKAGRAVAVWGLERLGIERLIWRADVGNHASRLVALRIGFHMEGTQRGALSAVDGSGARSDGWIGSIRPGDITMLTPESLSPASATARRARTFFQPMPVLGMPGGALRPHTDDDLDAITAACQDRETQQWTRVPAGYQRADAERFLRDHVRTCWLQGTAASFAIADGTGSYSGSVTLTIADRDPAVAEIGIQVAPWARRRGLGVAATRTLCAWGFSALGVERIVWRALPGNEASKRSALRSGFAFEGVQRQGCTHGEGRSDAWLASLLPADLPPINRSATDGPRADAAPTDRLRTDAPSPDSP